MEGFTGLVLAERGWPEWKTALVSMASLLLSASGSAILNGVLDAGIDMRMSRLRKRSEALEISGRGTMTAVAVLMIVIALILASRYLGTTVFSLILAAVVGYSLLYTLRLKRRSPWGAVAGGIPGALPVLIGYASSAETLRMDGIILFVFMLLWQPPHFWSLALGYRSDYLNAGVPVLPVSHGERFTVTLTLIHAVLLLPVSLSLWILGFCTAWYAVAALLFGAAFLAICWLNLVRTLQSGKVFGASILYLLLILAAIITDICLIQGA